MKTRLAVLVSILVVVAAYGGNSRAVAKTYYVSTSGNNSASGLAEKTAWRTITHAATRAQAGDTVKIKGGYYGHEHVVIQNSGTVANPIVLEGYGGTPLIDGLGGGGYGIDIRAKSHITIIGLAVTRYKFGILGRLGSSNITLRNITAYKNALGSSGYGILFEWVGNNIVISNCTAYNNDMCNFSIRGSSANCLIENCISYNKNGLGNYADYYYAMTDGANNNIIKDCTAGGYPQDGYYHSGHGYAFRRGASHNKVINCKSFYSGNEHFTAKEDSEYNEFINCIAAGYNAAYSVSGFNISASFNKVINCTIRDVRYGILIFYSAAEPSTNLPVRGNLFKNNIIVNNTYGILRSSKNTSAITNEYNDVWGNSTNYSGCSPGVGDISRNPLFVDSANGDYHLKSKTGRWDPDSKTWVKDTVHSPCIDVGDPTSEYKNEPAPNGGRINMGAYGNTNEASKSTIPQVKGRHIFYNRSVFDGNDAAANIADDWAIAPDKAALLPGGTATFANYTSYSRGINGIMVDIANLSGTPTAADFVFKVGNNSTPAAWATAPSPTSVSVRSGAGLDGADRITVIWPDNAIQKRWLQVTVKATAATGLAAAEVFYFGNAIGEMGNSTADARVGPTDEIGARNHPHSFGGPEGPAGIDDVYDFNRDRKVGPTDQILARNNSTVASTALKLVTAP